MLDIVIAKYNENIEWVESIKGGNRIYIYDKSTNPLDGTIPLENKYREAGTYLHHIIKHYDEINENVLFLQGHPFDHIKVSKETLIELINKSPEKLRQDEIWKIHYSRGDGCPDGCGLPVGEMYEWIGETPPLERYKFRAGAQYLITREEIKSRPRSFYERLFDNLNDEYGKGLCPWTIERLWMYIWKVRI